MTLSAISSIQARMCAIQALVQSPASAVVAAGSSSSTFASLLADEVARTSTTSLSTATSSSTASSSTALNSDGIPVALASYGNGRIPTSALDEVGSTGEYLWSPAAQQLEKLIAAAKADGVTIGVTDGYRTYDSQVQLVQEKGLYSQGGLAAAPGTSEHGWGMAADLSLNSSALAWMREHAAEYGFAETTPRESWHWSYHP